MYQLYGSVQLTVILEGRKDYTTVTIKKKKKEKAEKKHKSNLNATVQLYNIILASGIYVVKYYF